MTSPTRQDDDNARADIREHGREQSQEGDPSRGSDAAAATNRPERITLTATDGSPIAVNRWAPDTQPQGAVLVVPAMATPARFYGAFANWLAEQGYSAYTFDYRGYGASATGPLREVEADILDWGRDAATVLRWVHEDAAGLPVTWIGHSLGGQVLAFTPDELLDKALMVACGTGYWGHAEGMTKLLAPVLWYAISPIATRVAGYYPGKTLKLLGDLPAPVMRQWTPWCRNRDYALGVQPQLRTDFAGTTVPITSMSFTDDETMSAAATAQLESFYTGAPVTAKRIAPADLGVPAIGHMGIFRRSAQPLWARVFLPELAHTRR